MLISAPDLRTQPRTVGRPRRSSFPLDAMPYDVINELELRTDGTGDQYKLIAIFDETAFDRPEIQDLVQMVMGMEPQPRQPVG